MNSPRASIRTGEADVAPRPANIGESLPVIKRQQDTILFRSSFIQR
jgi:hypothetical protein